MVNSLSMAIYDLNVNVKYKMIDFEKIKFSKKFDCHYTCAESYNFKKIYIDTELSPKFRFEKWIGEECYILELPLISHYICNDRSRIDKFNVEVRAIVMKNNEYHEFYVHVGDSINFTLKDGAWTQLYMLDYGLSVFEFHKERLIEELQSIEEEKITSKYGLDLYFTKRRFSSNSLHYWK